MTARSYDRDWREEIALRDGTRVLLRLVRADDKRLLLRAFEQLSPRSRFLRFFADKTTLSPRELQYLTEMDQEAHVAIGAATPDEQQGLGVARFVRLAEDPQVAEPALVVVGSMRQKGLGTALLSHLQRAAKERGVERFRCEVLVANQPMRALLDELVPEASIKTEGEVLTVEWPVVVAEPAAPTAMARLLVWAAKGMMQLKHALFPGQERST